MAGPWEDYAPPEPKAGPWSDYAPTAADVGYDTAAGRAFTRGASFGLRDEGSGLIAAGGGDPDDPNVAKALLSLGRGVYRKLIAGDPEAQRLYQAEVERQRGQTKDIEKQYPGTSLAGEVAGAVAVPIGGALRAPTLAGRIGRGAALGAGTGALTGFGEGEGTAGSLTGAAIGAPLGAAVGGAAVPLVEGAVRGAGALISKPASIIAGNLNPERAAQRAVGRAAMEAERADPGAAQRFTQAQLGTQPEAIAADVLGEPGRRLARSASNISGEAAETLNQVIDPRVEGQAGRIGRWIDDTLNFPNAHAQQQALEATQRTANSAAYRRAYQQGAGGLWSPELERLASSDAVAGAMRAAVRSAGDEAVVGGRGGFNPRISFTPDGRIQFARGPSGVPTYPDLQYWDQVRRELSDAAIRAGRGTEEARRLGRFATALNTELDRAVPAYQAARRTAAGFFGAENALEAGQTFATQKFGNQEARQAVARMNDTERALFRDGYASRMKDIIANQGDRRDLVNKIANTPAAREKMEIALGRQRANELIAMMHAESIMQKLTRAVQGNSTTAMQLLGAGGAGAAGGGLLGYDPTVSGALTGGLTFLKGRGDRAVAQHVARLLTSRDPQTLRRGIAALARNQRNMAILAKIDEAVTRIAAQQGTQAAIPGRQAGGPVEEDQPYLVGEAGPEVFVPDDPWARAAARTGRRGRTEGAGTRFVEGGYGVPSLYKMLDEGAQRAFEEGGKIQHYGNEYYDAGPVTQQAMGAAGAPLVGPAQAGAVLGAGAIRRAVQAPAIRNADAPLFDYSRLREVPDVPQRDLQRYDAPRGIPERTQALAAPENVARVNEVVKRGAQQGGVEWYNTDPLRQAFISELGPKGEAAYRQYLDMVAATSPRSKVAENARNAAYYYGLAQRGEALPARTGNALDAPLPSPYGHIAQRLHVQNANNVLNEGGWPVLQNPKPASFVENLAGNQTPVTVDTHNARLWGMTDTKGRPVDKPAKTEYGFIERLQQDEARKLGLTPAQYQAAAWIGGGEQTGLKSSADPFLKVLEDRIRLTANKTGETPEEVLKRFIRGQNAPGRAGPLLSVAPPPVDTSRQD